MVVLLRWMCFALVVFAWSTADRAESNIVMACFAVVAGRKATADGSVLVGHNEQDRGGCLISFDCVSRMPFEQAVAEKYRPAKRLVPAGQTASFLWSQCVAKGAGDTYINEYGVAIVSDKCPTRQDDAETLTARGELRDGGINYLLRRLVAQQATTARDGVRIAGELIERFGYTPTGRTYIIADPNEAWLLALVGGRQWVAQRVPDDAVVILPNIHIIRQVDLTDTEHFLGSADLVDYAVRRGWYDRAVDGPFDFRKVYREVKSSEVDAAADKDAAVKVAETDDQNEYTIDGTNRPDPPDLRRWRAYQLITGQEVAWPPERPLPLWVRPSKPMSVESIMIVLRDRNGSKPISATTTVEAAVMQLRRDLPRAIGCVYWRATCEPSCSVLTPWYLGINSVPANYHEPVELKRRLSLEYQFNPPAATFRPKADLAWWKFKWLQDLVHEDYDGRIGRVRAVWNKFESRLLARQKQVEAEALRLWQAGDKDAARSYLTRYCSQVAEEARRETGQIFAVAR